MLRETWRGDVQVHIGGGSYTTLKRHLDTWRQRQAEREVKVAREQAAADVQAAQREQTAAPEELRRLEQVEAEQSQALEQVAAKPAAGTANRRLASRSRTRRYLQKRNAAPASPRPRMPVPKRKRWRPEAEHNPSVEAILTELRTKVDALFKAKRRGE